MEETTYYELPLYEGEDSPDLLECYNTSISDIDAILKTLSNAIAEMSNDIESLRQSLFSLREYILGGDLFQPNKYSQDQPVNVEDLEYLYQDVHGIIYNTNRVVPPPPPRPPIQPNE